MADHSALIETGRAMIRAARLDGQKNNTLPFDLGDLLVDVPDQELDEIAEGLGDAYSRNRVRSYQQVSRAWPVRTRVAAPWTTHRTLHKADNRIDLIQPGMTLRGAQRALGKTPSDEKHPSRWTAEEKALFIVKELADKAIDGQVRAEIEKRKETRAARATVRMVDDDGRAERRDNLRRLRDLQNAKSPERHAYEALFRLRDEREFVRYVGSAVIDPHSLIPRHLHGDLTVAVQNLAIMAVEVLGALESSGEGRRALDAVQQQLDEVRGRPTISGFDGDIIVVDKQARPNPFDLDDDDDDDEPGATGDAPAP